MTKSIKLDDQVHKGLERIQFKRETFSQTVARLIKFYDAIVDHVLLHAMDRQAPLAPGGQDVTKP